MIRQKIKNKSYDLLTNDIKEKIKLCLLSDIHYSKKSNLITLKSILEYLKYTSPTYTCICGDLLQDANTNKQEYDILLSYLENFAKVAPLMVTLGNHDVFSKNEKNIWTPYENKSFINELSSITNLHLLNNKAINFENISFSGHVLPAEHYLKDKESIESFYQEIKQIKLNQVLSEMISDKYKVSLLHSPFNILKEDVLEYLKLYEKTNLLLCGHMHNGLMPNFIENYTTSKIGLFAPNKSVFPKIARGNITYKNLEAIITSGIHKAEMPIMDFLIPPQIIDINIKKRFR